MLDFLARNHDSWCVLSRNMHELLKLQLVHLLSVTMHDTSGSRSMYHTTCKATFYSSEIHKPATWKSMDRKEWKIAHKHSNIGWNL